MEPLFPIYIISKGRWDKSLTAKALGKMGVNFRVVVEEAEAPLYAQTVGEERLLILDPEFQRQYQAHIDLEEGQSKGSGPARNFVWEHSLTEGHEWHWVIDDNIRDFYRLNRNVKARLYDGAFFRLMEEFVLRYTNVGMAGPNYEMFVPRKVIRPPFVTNVRIYSCILIRNDLPYRWHGRYNEDTILSLDVLKAGWATILFNAFLADKLHTQRLTGGNTDAFYAKEGTLPKSQMLVNLHPDVARLAYKWGRWHHQVNYRAFADLKLIRKFSLQGTEAINNYGLELVDWDWKRGQPA